MVVLGFFSSFVYGVSGQFRTQRRKEVAARVTCVTGESEKEYLFCV